MRWDGDLQERNNPMPRWWLWLFFLSMVFCFVYFALYPALGVFGNALGWSKAGQYEREMAEAKKQYAPIYAAFAGRDIVDLSKDPKALALGNSLFANNCVGCHGSDARGAKGFPNLTDNDWLYGGAPENIVQTITYGRQGVMPAWGAVLGGQGVAEVEAYVLSLSGRTEPADKIAAGAGTLHLVRRLSRRGRQGQPGHRRPQLDGRHLALWRLRNNRARDDHQWTPRSDAGPRVDGAGQDPPAGRLCLQPVAHHPVTMASCATRDPTLH